MIDAKYLRSVLNYDPLTGVFTWIKKTCHKVVPCKIAGCVSANGYVVIRVSGRLYTAHRLAWLYTHGTFPDRGIDHINKDRTDNRIDNLRLCTDAENAQNANLSAANTSGRTGVCFNKRRGKWYAQIMVNRKTIHLGFHETFDNAVEARVLAEEKYHPFKSANAR